MVCQSLCGASPVPSVEDKQTTKMYVPQNKTAKNPFDNTASAVPWGGVYRYGRQLPAKQICDDWTRDKHANTRQDSLGNHRKGAIEAAMLLVM